MAKRKAHFSDYYAPVMRALHDRGLLLGSYDAAGKANLMTIGWGSLGRIWNLPVWIVLVRPTRYSFECIEHSGCFSVNVPEESLGMACAICGSRNGRGIDQFAECGLTEQRGRSVLAPVVAECPIVYECQVVHSTDVQPSKLTDEILGGSYVDHDFHRIYFGKILEVRAEANAGELLGGNRESRIANRDL